MLRRRPTLAVSTAHTCWRTASALSAVRASACMAVTAASAIAHRPLHCAAARLHQRRGHAHSHGHSHSHTELLHDQHEHDVKPTLKPTAPAAAAAATNAAAATPTAAAASADAAAPAAAADAAPAKGPRYYLRKIKAMLQHYTLGAKLLWKNVKTSRAIRKKSVDGHCMESPAAAAAAAPPLVCQTLTDRLIA